MTHSEQDVERSWIVDELHAVEGFLGLSHYRGDRLRADEMERGRVALEKARAALTAAGYGLRQVPDVETVKAWALKEFGVSNGTQVWIEFQGDPDKFATAVLALMKGEK